MPICLARTGASDTAHVRDIPIRGEVIRLGQLLKLAGLADSGAAARLLLDEGEVTVNGDVERRRGRQLRAGDVVAAGGETVRIVSAAPAVRDRRHG